MSSGTDPALPGLSSAQLRALYERALAGEREARLAAAAATERAERVGALAAALGAAHTVQDVTDVLSAHVQQAVECQTFSLRHVDPDGNLCRASSMRGAPSGYEDRFAEVRLDVPSALAEVVATKRAVFQTSAEDNRSRYGTEDAEQYGTARIEALARLPLLVEDELIAILSVGYQAPREFDEAERLFLTTVANLAAQALARAMRTERLHRDERRHRLMSAAQAAINRRLDPISELRALARVVVPELADLCTVHVLTEPVPPGVMPPLPVVTDRVAAQIVEGMEMPARSTGLTWQADDPITQAIRHGKLFDHPIATPGVPDWAPRTGSAETFRAGVNQLILAPVLVGELVVAVACFGMCHDRPAWAEEDREILEEITAHTAIALGHGLSFQATRETALVLQQALMSAPPTVKGLELAGRYRPAGREKIGGDWFDAFETGPDRVALAVGDVVGHDINAAAAMGQLRAALRVLALDEALDPGAVLVRLAEANQALRMTPFATAAFARLRRTAHDWELSWALAGHPPPVLIEPTGAARPLEQPRGMALVPGFLGPAATARLRLEVGSTLLLYTDGLIERRGITLGSSISELCARAAKLVDGSLEDLCDDLLECAPTSDDVALLVVRIGA